MDSLLARGMEYAKRSLRQALVEGSPAVIAEVKKASPSKGVFRESFDPVELAQTYSEGGAAAISVVTEPEHFKGNGEWIASIRGSIGLPILRKDFIVDEIQVAESAALGADAVAIGTSALIAIGCQQYRICNTGKCPAGITTHDPELRKRLNIDQAAKGLENFLRASTDELRAFARLTGHNDVHGLSIDNLCTTNSEISGYTGIEHV